MYKRQGYDCQTEQQTICESGDGQTATSIHSDQMQLENTLEDNALSKLEQTGRMNIGLWIFNRQKQTNYILFIYTIVFIF